MHNRMTGKRPERENEAIDTVDHTAQLLVGFFKAARHSEVIAEAVNAVEGHDIFTSDDESDHTEDGERHHYRQGLIQAGKSGVEIQTANRAPVGRKGR